MPAIPLDTAGAVDTLLTGDIIVGGRTRRGGFTTAADGIIAGTGTPQVTPGWTYSSLVEARRSVRRSPVPERNSCSAPPIPESWDTPAT